MAAGSGGGDDDGAVVEIMMRERGKAPGGECAKWHTRGECRVSGAP